MDLISVIVPIYKVEMYLDKCIESLINQTYKNLEIILVDDGSPDRCPEICESWARKDERIKVIHKKNGGLSDARNAGLAVAKGEYISFIDSDDWIDLQFYEIMKNLIDSGADIAVCSVVLTDDEESDLGIQKSDDCELDTVLSMKHLVNEDILRQTVWNKLYRKKVIEEIPFLVGKCNEDDFWTYQVISKANKVKCCSRGLYFYRQRINSIMNVTYSRKRLDEIEARKRRYMYIVENFPELINEEKKSFFFSILYAYQSSLHIKDCNEKELCLMMIEQYFKFWKNAPGIFLKRSLSELVWVKMANMSLKFTAMLRNELRIGV